MNIAKITFKGGEAFLTLTDENNYFLGVLNLTDKHMVDELRQTKKEDIELVFKEKLDTIK